MSGEMPSSPPIEGEGAAAGPTSQASSGDGLPNVNTVPRGTTAEWRRFAVAVLVVIASLAGAATGVAWWARQTALDTDTYSAIADEALASVAVQEVISRHLVGAVLEVVSIEELAASALPGDQLDFLGGTAEGFARGWLEDLVADLLAQPGIRQALGFVNREAHEQIVPLLRDENQYIRIEGDSLVVDATPVADQVGSQLDAIGLGSALDRLTPDDLTFVVSDIAELAQAKRAVGTLDTLVVVLPLMAIAAAISAVVVARRRARAITLLGIGLATASFVTLLVEAVAQWSLLSAVTDPLAQLAGDSLWDIAASGLVRVMVLLIVLGGVAAGAGALLERKGPGFLTDRRVS